MKIKIKTDCSICGVPTLAGQVLEVGVNVSERDAHTLKAFGLAEDQAEAIADLAEAGEAIEPAEEVEEAEAVTEEADPLADALEDQAEAVVAPAQKKKGK